MRLYPAVDLGRSPDSLLQELLEYTPWRSEEITLYGKRYRQPRLSAWYGDPDSRYAYSGLALEPLPWTDTLLAIRHRLEDLSGGHFNSVLLNYYRDQRDSMGMHADDETELGPDPLIASLSLGDTRTLVLKHRQRPDLDSLRLPLAHGSLLLMGGSTQRCWKHGINKEKTPCGPRINLTFRLIRGRNAS